MELRRFLLRFARLAARVRKVWELKRNASGQIYVQDRVSEYREIWKAVAEKVGARFSILGDSVWELELNGKKTRMKIDLVEFDNPVTLEIAGMKPLVYKLFSECGLQVPDHQVYQLDNLDCAWEFLKRYPRGCVVKPANGTSSGRGVSTHVLTRRELRKASILASLYGTELLIEPMVPGECYRLLVLDGEVIHAVRRRGPRVIGDGLSTLARLILAENECRKVRGENILDFDQDLLFTLGYQNLSLESVPSQGRTVVVKSVNDPHRKRVEVRTVYNEAVIDLVCESLREDAGSAAKILNSRLVGVDFITVDPTIPLAKSGGVINEVNTTPGLHHHYDSSREPYPEAALRVVRALLNR